MPMDKMGMPRSGHARMQFADGAHGGQSKEKSMSSGGGGEHPGGETHMHAHSHKGGEHDVSKMPIEDVVDQHGPATKIFSEHEDEQHHVHSVHGEKHHHSDHETMQAAHEHMGKAMDVGGEGMTEESPDEAENMGGDGGGDGEPPAKHAWMS